MRLCDSALFRTVANADLARLGPPICAVRIAHLRSKKLKNLPERRDFSGVGVVGRERMNLEPWLAERDIAGRYAAPTSRGVVLVILKTLAGPAKGGSLTFDKLRNLHFSQKISDYLLLFVPDN